MNADYLAQLLLRTNELLTVLAKAAVKPALETELSTPQRRKLYDLTGGDFSIDQISKKLRMSTGAISTLWQRWESVGLLIKDGKRYRKVLGE